MTIEDYLSKAYDLSRRSPMKRFGVGAVIVNKGRIVSQGWNHASNLRLAKYISIHAEVHAIHRANPKDLKGATIYIVSSSKKSRNRNVGAPCSRCLAYLEDVGVDKIVHSINNQDHFVWQFGDPGLETIRTRGIEDIFN